jgi:hypothetical protein
VRAGKPGTETSAPNTSLNPPLNPSSLPSLTLTGLLNVRLLQLLLAAADASVAAPDPPRPLLWSVPPRRRTDRFDVLRRWSTRGV